MQAFRVADRLGGRARPLSVGALLILASLALAGCDSAETRAENHYQRGMALMAEGDTDRALVEFRNVFRLNGAHVPARIEYARAVRERGDTREAYAQYLRVAELDRNNLEAERALAEMALMAQDFDAAEEHVLEAWRLSPTDPVTRAVKATLEFRNPEKRTRAVEMARGVVAEVPGNVMARMVLIADRLNDGKPDEALPLIDAGLAVVPEDQGLHVARLAALERMGDTAGTGAQLRRMAELFPEDPGARQALITWYQRAGDIDGAEAVLRERADRVPPDPEAALDLTRFLMETRGIEAARTELDTRIGAAGTGDVRPLRQARAAIDFMEGKTDAAIAAMRALLEEAEPSDTTRETQVALARMLVGTGATEPAGQLLDEVLAGDENHVEALKLRAKLAIDADRPDAAIQDMRTASASAPRDPGIMTLMAEAHERAGSRELAGERLALAVEYSQQAPDESLRYARYLMRDNRLGPAEGVVTDALRRAPEDTGLLMMLGQIHLERKDWSRAGQVAGLLRGLGTPEAEAMAAGIATASLRGQGRTAEVITALESMAGTEGDNPRAMAEVARSHVEAGDPRAARRYIEDVLARDPANQAARLLAGQIDQAEGNLAAAEAAYRAVIAAVPDNPAAYQALFALMAAQGRRDEAEAALDAGLAAAPETGELIFARAGMREGKGDIDGAIADYEQLYARDSSSPVLANNLASLLASYRDDPASLDRAFAIARRLRDTEVPHFQDTYGWILHRRGDTVQALTYLEPAAAALPDAALAQFHLGDAQFALGRREAARASYEKALAAAERGSPLPRPEAIRARITEIDATSAAPDAPETPAAPG